jgi:Transglycosylase SLT domain.
MKNLILCILLLGICVLCLPPYKDVYARTKTIPEVVEQYALQYQVSYQDMIQVMRCESRLNPKATNKTSKEFSVGIAQINLKAHKNITEEQARDVEFASEFMAREFSNGNQHIWTCSKITGVI